jgi:hypothetical protein
MVDRHVGFTRRRGLSMSAGTRACALCGALAAEDAELPAGWSLQTDERGVGLLCLECTRTNIRSIEAKLPEEWWR